MRRSAGAGLTRSGPRPKPAPRRRPGSAMPPRRSAAPELERARHALLSAREHEAALRIERRSAEEPLASLAARRGAIEELERERVGLAPAARQLLAERGSFGDAILGPLSDFVRVS